MKISQLFLCWTFTRLHVTKYPAFCLVPPLLHPILQLYYQLNVLDANESTPMGLPCPAPQNSMTMTLTLRFGGKKTNLHVFENSPRRKQQQLCPRARWETTLCTCQEPSRHVCLFLSPLWPQGLWSPVGLSADTFQQAFSFSESFLTHVLGQMRTLSRVSLPSESVSVALSGRELFAAVILSNPPCFWRKCRADLECVFDLGDVFQGLISRLLTTEQEIPVVIAVCLGWQWPEHHA